jgi:hypothetical protein
MLKALEGFSGAAIGLVATGSSGIAHLPPRAASSNAQNSWTRPISSMNLVIRR